MHEGYEFAGMKILIVEDVPEDITILSKVLEKLEIAISIAPDGKAALESALKINPDLILLDIGLPGIDGFEVCRRLKKEASLKKIPVIFLTARANTDDMVKGLSLGGVDYITKPYNHEEVISRITTQLCLVQTTRELMEKEKFYRNIVEHVPELIFELGPNRTIRFANAALKMLGYDPHELIGKPLADIIDADDKEDILEALATRDVGPLSTYDLEVTIKANENSTLSDHFQSKKFIFEAMGVWDVSDEEVFKNVANKNFIGTLCIGKCIEDKSKPVEGSTFIVTLPEKQP